MSICIFKGVNVKLYRRVFVLANHKAAPQPANKCFRRSTHNSLYQMVKKRTLEARTKLQPTKYPKSHPCVSSPPTTKISTTKSSSTSSSASISGTKTQTDSKEKEKCQPVVDKSKAIKSESSASKPNNNSGQAQSEGPKAAICKNTKVLNTSDCSRSGGGAAGGGDGSRKGSNKSDDDDAETKKKFMWGILAALGAGGLLFWLLAGEDKDASATKGGAGGSGASGGGADGSGAAGGGGSRAAGAAGSGSAADDDSESRGYGGSGATSGKERIPQTSAELPKHVPYLLIGAGTASFSAFRAIKSNDPKAKVLMITDEYRKPYMRPPLSKELWYSAQPGASTDDYRFKQWTGAERSLYFEPEEFFVDPRKLMESVNGGVSVAQGFKVRRVDPAKHIAVLSDGTEISYDECLIAPGCRPRGLKVFTNASPAVREKVMVFRTPEDFERLKKYADEKKSITIVGNGFTGSELACSLSNYTKERGVRIYQVFPENANMSKVLPSYLCNWTTKKVEELGVCVVPNAEITSVQRTGQLLKLGLSNGNSIITDIVVLCVGCDPNTDIAITSGLETHRSLGGFVVNAELEARRNLFVAGDACCFYDQLLGRRRVEHHDHSVISGRLAGENMVGKKKAYQHQSMFWSDLGPEIGYEGIGLVDGSLPTVGVFALPSKDERKTDNPLEPNVELVESNAENNDKEPTPAVLDETDGESYGRGVVFYLKDDKIVGILLWNLFNRIGLARTIITQNKKYEDLNEVAKLFEIHT